MKLLKINQSSGYFYGKDGSWHEIDQITKDALLWILEKVLEGPVELEEYDEATLKNQAHQVVYKSVYTHLKALEARREEFIDESERLFLEDYHRYVTQAQQQELRAGATLPEQ